MKKTKGLVYSTEFGAACPGCGHPKDKCACSSSKKSNVKSDGWVRLSRQTKGRKGAGATLITGLDLPEKELKNYAKKLKKKCGCGGSIKDGIVEIQGDQRDILQPLLEAEGFKVKRAGG